MNNYAYLIKSKAKAVDLKPLFCWISAKSESRADRDILNILEDNGIEVGRRASYQLPVRTNWLIVDDLPEEGALDDTWCDRYELEDDNVSWKKIVVAVQEAEEEEAENTTPITGSGYAVQLLPFRMQVLAQYISPMQYAGYITWEQRLKVSDFELDTDNSYVQNLLLVAESNTEFKKYDMYTLWKLVTAIKTVFEENKRHELGTILQFANTWHATNHLDRGILVKEWVAGKRITSIQRTETGANAGGGNKTDRLTPLTPIGLACEIAYGLLARDNEFDIYSIPLEIDAQANSMLNNRDNQEFVATVELFKSMPGGLDFSRACNIATVKTTPENLYLDPPRHREHLNRVMTETDHANPDALTVDIACGRSSAPMPMALPQSESTQSNVEKRYNELRAELDEARNNIPPKNITVPETTSNEQMEETEHDETEGCNEIFESETTALTTESGSADGLPADAVNDESGHHNELPPILCSHLMIDLETMGKKSDAPIVSIGAVFFDPASGILGAEFYKVISLESAVAWGGVPDASTIIWWLKQSSEARSAIAMDDAIRLDDALLQLTDFICENAANGPGSVEVWGNGATFDNVITRNSYERTGLDCPWKFTNDRDVRTIVALGKTVGCDPRYQLPFVGDAHNALADARHQAKYVSVIWQRLTTN